MTLRPSAPRAPEQAHQTITSIDPTNGWAGLIGFACPIYFTSGDSCDSKLRAFPAPDWAVAVPNGRWGALEPRTGRDHLRLDCAGRKEIGDDDADRDLGQKVHQRPRYGSQPTPSLSRSRCAP